MSSSFEKVKKQVDKKVFTDITGYYLDYNTPLCKKIFKGWDNHPVLEEKNQTASFLESYDRHLRKVVKKSI